MNKENLKFKVNLQLFGEESEQTSESGENTENADVKQYIEAINEIKKNTVSKEKYEKLEAERNELLESLVNGQQVVIEGKEEEKVDLKSLRKEIFSSDLLNLDFTKKMLQVRKEILKNGGQDPFVGFGKNFITEAGDYVSAQNVADVLEQCVEAANGDSGIFTAALNARILDVKRPTTRR